MNKLTFREIFSPANRPFGILSGDGKKKCHEQYTCDPRPDVSAKERNDKEESNDQTLGSNAEEKPQRGRPQLLQEAILSHSSTGIYFLVGKWQT
jgi:hypothetical protein